MTPANGEPAPEAAAEAELPPEEESEVDAFQRKVDDLVFKTDVVILLPFTLAPSRLASKRQLRRGESVVWNVFLREFGGIGEFLFTRERISQLGAQF